MGITYYSVYKNSTGNVGIGTTSPASRLHVVGSEAYIRVTDSDDSGVFFIGNTSGFGYIRAFSRDFRFLNAAGASLINIASGGNIGIGTTTPADKLDVVGRVYAYRYIAVSSNAASPAYATDTSSGMFNAGSNIIGFSISSAEKVRIDAGGNLGVGITSLVHKIQAAGLISAGDATYNNNSTFIGAILNNDQTNPGLDLRRWNGGGAGTNNHGATYIATNSAGDTLFYNGLIAANTRATSEKMRISVNGGVGIGTTSPSLTSGYIGLNVVNEGYTQIKVQSSASSAGIEFKPSSGNSWELQANNSSQWFVYDRTQELYRLTIDVNGKVGIGASPTAQLHINSSTSAIMKFDRSGASTFGFEIGATTFGLYDYTNSEFRWRAESRNLIINESYGNVGIGTTSPLFKLDNYNDTFRSLSRVSEKIVSVGFDNAIANQKVDITFDVTPGTNVFWGNLEVEITDGYSNQNATGKLIKVFAVGLNPATGAGPYGSAIYDNSSYYTAAYGAVVLSWAIDGIFFNTTTGKYYFTVIHRTSTGNSPVIKIKGYTVTPANSDSISKLTAGSVYTTNTTVYYQPVVETAQSRIGYNGNINQSGDLIVQGNVGIGTTGPASKLDVRKSITSDIALAYFVNDHGTDTRSYIYIGSSPGTDWKIGKDLGSVGNSRFFISDHSNNERLTISTNGNVGIGTSSPGQKLEVATTTSNTRVRINSTEVVATEYFRSGTGVWLVGSDSSNSFKIARASNFGTNDYLSINSATADVTFFDTALGARMTLNGTGLGIGTTSPANKLDVVSATANNGSPFAGCFFSGDDSSASWRCAVNLQHNANTTIAIGSSVGLSFAPLSSTSSNFYGSAAIKGVRPNTTANNQDTDLAFWTRTGASNTTVDTEKLRITGTGNVGIGTTSPGYKLDVSGTGRFTGDLTLSGALNGAALNGTTGFFSSDLSIVGQHQIRNANPTITFRDTNNRTAYIHVNGDIFYVLTAVADSAYGSWGQVANSRWPLELNLSTNNAVFGADVNAISFTGAGTGLTGTAASLSIGGAAGSINGFNNPTTAATVNTIVYRDSGGDISTRYFLGSYVNSTDDTSSTGLTYIMAKFGNDYHRSASAAKVATFISGQTMDINGSSTSCSGSAASAGALNTNNDYTVASLTSNGFVYSGSGAGSTGAFYFNTSSHGIRRASGTNDVYCYTTSGTLYLGAGGSSTTHVRVTSGGDVGIGVSPSYKLDVNGNIHATAFPTSSDIRFKKNITALENSLEKVKKLQGVKYEWNEFVNSVRDGYKLNVPIIGLIAQDVEKIVPEVVDLWKLSDECQDARSIDYPRLTPLLIEAIKEQQIIIENQNQKIENLIARMSALEAK